MEVLDEKRTNAKDKWMAYHKQISKAYNKKVKPRYLCVGDLNFTVRHVLNRLNASKFAFKWEGMFVNAKNVLTLCLAQKVMRI